MEIDKASKWLSALDILWNEFDGGFGDCLHDIEVRLNYWWSYCTRDLYNYIVI